MSRIVLFVAALTASSYVYSWSPFAWWLITAAAAGALAAFSVTWLDRRHGDER